MSHYEFILTHAKEAPEFVQVAFKHMLANSYYASNLDALADGRRMKAEVLASWLREFNSRSEIELIKVETKKTF